MNEELKNKMSEYLVVLERDLKSVKDFSAEQVPLVVQEYINWIFWQNCVIAFFMVIMIAILYRIWKWIMDEEDVKDDIAPKVFISCMAMLLASLPSIQLIDSTTKMIKTTVAPRVVIIEKISELVKENK